MATGFYNLDQKEVIRIKVKKCDGKMQPEYKKFSIDPQITSFEMLQGILARAFDIKSDFTISYQAIDAENQPVYLSMLSDWDMDAAFQCAADPCLKLKVDLRPFEEDLEEWDVIAPVDIPQHRITSLLDKNSLLGSITGSLSLNLGRTVNSMQRAMGLKHGDAEDIKPIKPPMSDMEFHNYLDSAGYMIKPNEFRLSIYQGGIETSLRRVAWRHLLNVFPVNMSGRDRFDYMKRKEEEYRKLREEWRERFRTNTVTEEVKYVASMVKKDVLRTDRTLGFYAGNDENENTLALFHILVTYALTHPDTSYCQGMSDLASPLLVTQKDEAQAYICFCSLMERLRENFTVDGDAIMLKFKHLLELMAQYDPDLHAYLVEKSSGDIFFCYRWLLLELKREFPFNDALHVLEVMWATLPPSPPQVEVSLVAPDYSCRLLSSSPCSPTFSFQQAMYAKLLAMRRVGALQRVAQAGLAVPKSPQQLQITSSNSSADNNLHPSSHNSDGNNVSIQGYHHSAVSSSDASPVDFDDKGLDFPEIENPLLKSLQKKSDSIDQVLLEVPKEPNRVVVRSYDNAVSCVENNNDVEKRGRDVESSLMSQSLDNDDCAVINGILSDRSGKAKSIAEELNESGEQDNSCSPSVVCNSNSYSGVNDNKEEESEQPAEEDSDSIEFNPTHFTFEPVEYAKEKTSSAADQLAFTDSSEQVQFTLSMDSNTYSSVELSQNSHDSYVHCGSGNAELPSYQTALSSGTNTNTSHNQTSKSENSSSSSSSGGGEMSESSSGLFQSMKRLLSSPKKKQNNNANANNNAAVANINNDTSLQGSHLSSNANGNNKNDLSNGVVEANANTNRQNSGNNNNNSNPSDEYNNGTVNATPPVFNDKIILRDPSKLPLPQMFGAGNPFLMFLCFTIISQHREAIMRNGLCYEEIAMHFDRLVRRHNASHVLHHARQLYTQYLKSQQANIEKITHLDKN